jgi:hypothetical protein
MVLLALSIVIIGYKVTQKLNEKTVDTVITDLKSLNWKDLNNTVGVLSSPDFKQALNNIQGLNVDQVNTVIGDVQGSWSDIKKGLEKFESLNIDDITNTIKQGLTKVELVGNKIQDLDVGKVNTVLGDVQGSWGDIQNGLKKFESLDINDITKTIKQGMQEFESVGSKIQDLDVDQVNTVIGDVQGSWSDIQNGLKTVNRISNDLDDNTITSFKNIINSPSVQTISQNLCDPINIPIKAGFLGSLPVVGAIPHKASTVSIKLPGCSSKTNFDFEDEYDFY